MSTNETRETSEASASVDESTEDVSRRELVMKLLGAAAGGVALQALSGCVAKTDGSDDSEPEDIGRVIEAVSGDALKTKYADTVAELRGITNGAVKWIAILGGYWTRGDGGGGVFYWDSTAAQDNGGTILNSGSGNSAGWRRIYSGPLDVRWFGCKCNGLNDAAAFSSALAALQSSGTLLISGLVSLGSAGWTGVRIVGKTNVSIVAKAPGCGFKFLARPSQTLTIGGQPQVYGMVFEACDKLALHGLLFEGDSVDTSLLGLQTVSRSIVADCQFKNTGNAPSFLNHGLASYGGSTNLFRGNRIENCHYATVIGLCNTGCVETESEFAQNILANNVRGGIGTGSKGCQFSNNVIIDCDHGFTTLSNSQETCYDITFSGNTVRRCGRGIRTDPAGALRVTGFVISDNVVDDCTQSAIYVTEIVGLTIVGNMLRNNNKGPGAPAGGGGILVQYADTVTVANNIVTDDQATSTHEVGINVGGDVANAVISGNLVDRAAAGAYGGTGIAVLATEQYATTNVTVSNNVVTRCGHAFVANGSDTVYLCGNEFLNSTIRDIESFMVGGILKSNGDRYASALVYWQDSWSGSGYPLGPVSIDGTQQRLRAAAPPSVGPWQPGDTVYNTNPGAPSPNNVVGWVCTAAGPPPVWKSFGTLV